MSLSQRFLHFIPFTLLLQDKRLHKWAYEKIFNTNINQKNTAMDQKKGDHYGEITLAAF